jgi:hypothetical protein
MCSILNRSEALGTKSDLNIASPSAAVAQNRGLDNHEEEVEQIESSVVNPKIQLNETISTPSEAEMLENDRSDRYHRTCRRNGRRG